MESFSKKYRVHRLVYYEVHDRIDEAIVREKALKFWKRKWKMKLIEDFNPEWLDLYDGLFEGKELDPGSSPG